MSKKKLMIFHFLLVILSIFPPSVNVLADNTASYSIGSLEAYSTLGFLPEQINIKKSHTLKINLNDKKIFYDESKVFPHNGIINKIEIQLVDSGIVQFYLDELPIYNKELKKGYNKLTDLEIKVFKGQKIGLKGNASFITIEKNAFEKYQNTIPLRITVFIDHLYDQIYEYGYPIDEEVKQDTSYNIASNDTHSFIKNHSQPKNFFLFKLLNLILPLIIAFILFKYFSVNKNFIFLLNISYVIFCIFYYLGYFNNFLSNLTFFITYIFLFTNVKLINLDTKEITNHAITISAYTLLLLITTIFKFSYIYMHFIILLCCSYSINKNHIISCNLKSYNFFLISLGILTLAIIDIYFANFTSLKFDKFEHLARSANIFLNNYSFGEPGIAYNIGIETFSNAYNFSSISYFTQYFFFNDGTFSIIKYYEFYSVFSILHYGVAFLLIALISNKYKYLGWSIYMILMTAWNILVFLPYMGFTDHSLLFYPTEFTASFLVPLIVLGVLINFKNYNFIYTFIISILILIASLGHLQNFIIISVLYLTGLLFILFTNNKMYNFILINKLFILPTILTILTLLIFNHTFEIPAIDKANPYYYSIFRDYPLNMDFLQGHYKTIQEYYYEFKHNYWNAIPLIILFCFFPFLLLKKTNTYYIKWIFCLSLVILSLKLSYSLQNYLVPIISFRPFHAIGINFNYLLLIFFSILPSILLKHFYLFKKNENSIVVYSNFYLLSIFFMIFSISQFLAIPAFSGISYLDYLHERPVHNKIVNKNCFSLDNNTSYALSGLSTSNAYYLSKNYGGFFDFRKDHAVCFNDNDVECIPKACVRLN